MIVETINSKQFNNKCPTCSNKITKDLPRNITKGPVDKYNEDGDYHYHNTGIYEGRWYCDNGHQGLYYQHRLCDVIGCDYNKI